MAKAARQEEMMKKTSVRASAAVEVGQSDQLELFSEHCSLLELMSVIKHLQSNSDLSHITYGL